MAQFIPHVTAPSVLGVSFVISAIFILTRGLKVNTRSLTSTHLLMKRMRSKWIREDDKLDVEVAKISEALNESTNEGDWISRMER